MSDKYKDHHVAVEYTRAVLPDIRKRLQAGADGDGVMLTADECLKLLASLQPPAFPKGQPPKDGVEKAFIAMHYRHLRRNGVSRKNALTDTAAHFGCSPSTVRGSCNLI